MRALLIVFATMIVTACGGSAKHSGSAKHTGSAKPGTPQAQLKQLWSQHESMRSQLGMTRAPRTTDAGAPDPAGKTTTTSTPTSAPERVASACPDVCRITTSICANATSICRIAKEHLPDDQWAQNMCRKATESCTTAKSRCDTCQSSN